MNMFVKSISIALFLFTIACSQGKDTSAIKTVSAADTSTIIKAARKTDSLSARAPMDTATGKIKLVKRNHNGRQQVVLATCMMIFVAGMITAAQAWNPR